MTRRPPRRFSCTPAGRIAIGRRRLKLLLLGLALLMLGTGAGTLWAGRPGPAILAIAVSLVTWKAWGMIRDLHPLCLEVDGSSLTVRRRREQESLPLEGTKARPLTGSELEHLERLATNGPVALGTGGFESHLLGEFDLYASNLEAPILLSADETQLIVTPDESEEFLKAIADASKAHGAG